jgi:hypothetical protein
MSEPTTGGEPGPRRPWPVTFADGAQGLAVGYAASVLDLVCERAHPPGRPLAITLQLPETALTLRGKSAGSKHRDDQRYDVRLRLHSLRKHEREQLEQAFAYEGSVVDASKGLR